MNGSQNHDPAHAEDPADRLVDFALTELVGGTALPDLSVRIIAAASVPTAVVAPNSKTRRVRSFWVGLAVAATLLIGATVVMLPQFHSARKMSRVAMKEARLGNSHDSARPFPMATTAPPVATNETIKETDLDSWAVPLQSTIATNRYDKAAKSTENLSLSPSQTQSVPEVPPQVASRPGGPTGGSPLKDFYGPTEFAAAPGLQPAGDEFGFSTSDPNQLAGRAGRPGGGRVKAVNTTAPRAGLEMGDRGAVDGESEVPGFSAIATDDVKEKMDSVSLGYEWKENATTQLVDEIRELQRQGKPTEKQKKELQRRLEKSVDLSEQTTEGNGPHRSGDKYTRIIENPFIKAEGGAAVSTLSIDVDTASYANVRQFLLQMNQLPPPDAVRIEELINYFHYDYAGPPSAPGSAGGSTSDEAPFAAHVEVTGCPWAPEHRLARIGIKGREMDRNKRPQSNLVFLVDVSGSMNEPAKLPLVVYGLEQLTRELGENDHIAIVVYAGTEGLVLPSTSGSKQDTILAALAKLQAGGSTAGGAGIQLAYQIAEDNFIKGGTNRVILCTDGDFNVGVTNTADLQRLVEQKAKDTGVFLSTLGFGRGNLNDAMMVAISDHGNGNYHYIDNRTEARRVLVEEMTGTLVTIAKDVKIQVEFNPTQVAGYRLIGYEKRALRTEDFNDDKKDAGEIGAGHTVTALYEIIPAGKKVGVGPVDDLKYQTATSNSDEHVKLIGATNKELLTLKMRYKAPDGDTSKKLEWPITDDGKSFAAASGDLKFAASVAGFGLVLRNSQYKGNLTYAAVIELAQGGIGEDPHGYRKEFLDMVRKAKDLRHE